MSSEVVSKVAGRIPEQTAIPRLDTIPDSEVDVSLVESLPLSFVKSNLIFPIKRDGDTVTVAIGNPKNLFALDDLARRSAQSPPAGAPSGERATIHGLAPVAIINRPSGSRSGRSLCMGKAKGFSPRLAVW